MLSRPLSVPARTLNTSSGPIELTSVSKDQRETRASTENGSQTAIRRLLIQKAARERRGELSTTPAQPSTRSFPSEWTSYRSASPHGKYVASRRDAGGAPGPVTT